MPRFKSSNKSGFKLVGSDKQSKSDKREAIDNDAPEPLHFPEHTPWGDRNSAPDTPKDILETIEGQIDRAQAALDRLGEDTDVLFRISDDKGGDDNTPAAA